MAHVTWTVMVGTFRYTSDHIYSPYVPHRLPARSEVKQARLAQIAYKLLDCAKELVLRNSLILKLRFKFRQEALGHFQGE